MEEADRTRAEVALQSTALELQRKAELAELAAHVAHDFNNYLTIIRLTATAHASQEHLPAEVLASLGQEHREVLGYVVHVPCIGR